VANLSRPTTNWTSEIGKLSDSAAPKLACKILADERPTSFHFTLGRVEDWRLCLRSGENNKRYFRFLSALWRLEHRGRLQNDGGTENACRAHESAQAGDETIRGTQVGRTLSTTIEDQQLMPERCGFSDDGTESARPCQSGQNNDQMNE